MSKPVSPSSNSKETTFVNLNSPSSSPSKTRHSSKFIHKLEKTKMGINTALEKTKEAFLNISPRQSPIRERKDSLVRSPITVLKYEQGYQIKKAKNFIGELSETEEEEMTEEIKLPILIVEDNELNLRILSRVIQKSSYVIEVAKDGEEAIEKINQHDYSILFTDHMMPKKTGLEVVQEVRSMKEPLKRKLPIVVQSDTADIQNIYKNVSVQGFMGKIGTPGQIVEQLDRLNLANCVEQKATKIEERKVLRKETDGQVYSNETGKKTYINVEKPVGIK